MEIDYFNLERVFSTLELQFTNKKYCTVFYFYTTGTLFLTIDIVYSSLKTFPAKKQLWNSSPLSSSAGDTRARNLYEPLILLLLLEYFGVRISLVIQQAKYSVQITNQRSLKSGSLCLSHQHHG